MVVGVASGVREIATVVIIVESTLVDGESEA